MNVGIVAASASDGERERKSGNGVCMDIRVDESESTTVTPDNCQGLADDTTPALYNMDGKNHMRYNWPLLVRCKSGLRLKRPRIRRPISHKELYFGSKYVFTFTPHRNKQKHLSLSYSARLSCDYFSLLFSSLATNNIKVERWNISTHCLG